MNTYPRFISNSPVGKDLLTSGSHSKTSQSIVEHLKCQSEDFRLIGLDGDWGSGKSNVIKMVQNDLKETHHTFIYDVWAHQEDLQRRSFLEELTQELHQNKVLKSSWEKRLKDLLTKKVETTRRTIPKVSKALIVAVVIGALMVVAKTISETIDNNDNLKIIIVCAPLVLAFIIWSVESIFKGKPIVDELFHLYSDKVLHENVNEAISEDEPSVTQFRKWLDELSSDLKKEVTIVFDNMDRLPPDKVAVMWTLIHTFFSSKTYKKIWVIVPFDRKHVKAAFNWGYFHENDKADHFINKTFSVVFSISPPVLTDWKDLFSLKYNEAFGDFEKNEQAVVTRIFNLYIDDITPRKIIAFINDLVTVKIVRKNEIPLRYIALFILQRQKLMLNPVTEILNREYLQKAINIFRDDENVADYIGSLVYNVSVEKASQITLSRYMEITIRNQKISDFIDLSNHQDFVPVLESLSFDDLSVDDIAMALSNVQEKNPSNLKKDSIEHVWHTVLQKQLGENIEKLEFSATHKHLFENCHQSKYKVLAKYLITEFSRAKNFDGSLYYKELQTLQGYLENKQISLSIFDFILPISWPSNVFLDFVSEAKEDYKQYKFSTNPEQLDTFLSSKVPDNLEDVELLKYISAEYQFPQFKKRLKLIIDQGDVTVSNVERIFLAYRCIIGSNLVDISLPDERIYAFLNAAGVDTPEYYELAAMRIARGEDFQHKGGVDGELLKRVDDSVVNQIADRLPNYTDITSLLLGMFPSKHPLVCKVLERMIQRHTGMQGDLHRLLPKYFELRTSLNISDQELFDEFGRWMISLKGISPEEMITTTLSDYRIFEAATKISNDLSVFIVNTGLEYIYSLQGSNWNKSFAKDNTFDLRLLSTLLESGHLKFIPGEAFNEYKQTLRNIATGDRKIPTNYSPWQSIFKNGDKLHLKGSVKTIRDLYLSSKQISAEQFLFFEPLFRELGDLSERAKDVVRRILTPISKNENCLNQIFIHRLFYTELINSAGDEGLDIIAEIRNMFSVKSTNTEIEAFTSIIDKHLSSDVKVISAFYFSPEKPEGDKHDVTQKVKDLVQNHKLHFKISNALVDGHEPDFGVVKKLEVSFLHKGIEKYKMVNEHEWISFP